MCFPLVAYLLNLNFLKLHILSGRIELYFAMSHRSTQKYGRALSLLIEMQQVIFLEAYQTVLRSKM